MVKPQDAGCLCCRDGSKQDVPSVSIDTAVYGPGAEAATAEAALHVAAAAGPSLGMSRPHQH